MKTAMLNTRIDPRLKNQAESILHKVGLSSAEAVRLFYKQICLHKGLPFEIKVPNSNTIKAMRDADEGKTIKGKDVDDLFNEF